jgi:hypothetical protein
MIGKFMTVEVNGRNRPDACSCRGCSVVSRLCNLYPERLIALAFLAVGYVAPAPEFNLPHALTMTKQAFGYELVGYWLFFAEDGADKLIETHVCPLSYSTCT